jgi:hypothetical protein
MIKHRLMLALVVHLVAGVPAVAAPRDPSAAAAAIDRTIDQKLADATLRASAPADDSEFIRRVTLDIAGRIPTLERTIAFLDDKSADKRRKLIDELLSSKEYAENFGAIWRNLLAPRGNNVKGKAPPDQFTPWLVEQFSQNRGWDKIVAELLTAAGDIAKAPQTAFLMANAEDFRPQADRLTASTARYFLGVRLGCAECHDHPFSSWKQTDFWGTAAFFSRLRNTSFKGQPFILTEEVDPKPPQGYPVPPIRPAPGGGVILPATVGKASGQTMSARLLGGADQKLDDKPLRPLLAAWLTAKENPFFAPAQVNRVWSHFFGRGLVNPVDDFRDNNPPTHPEVLALLADEFRNSDFDFKHLIRCICNSQAYQRTSRPLPENELDRERLSHMTVKILSPEAFYDSLAMLATTSKTGPGKPGVGKPNSGKPGAIKPDSVKPGADKPKPNADTPMADMPGVNKPNAGKPKADMSGVSKPGVKGQGSSREDFLQLFRAQGESDDVNLFRQGVPQFLRRLNGEGFNQGSPLIERLMHEGADRKHIVESLYLAALSRRPSAEEFELMNKYLDRRPDAAKGYAGVLWILLSSGEFALNH